MRIDSYGRLMTKSKQTVRKKHISTFLVILRHVAMLQKTTIKYLISNKVVVGKQNTNQALLWP